MSLALFVPCQMHSGIHYWLTMAESETRSLSLFILPNERALVGNAKSIGGQCKEHWWAMQRALVGNAHYCIFGAYLNFLANFFGRSDRRIHRFLMENFLKILWLRLIYLCFKNGQIKPKSCPHPHFTN